MFGEQRARMPPDEILHVRRWRTNTNSSRLGNLGIQSDSEPGTFDRTRQCDTAVHELDPRIASRIGYEIVHITNFPAIRGPERVLRDLFPKQLVRV